MLRELIKHPRKSVFMLENRYSSNVLCIERNLWMITLGVFFLIGIVVEDLKIIHGGNCYMTIFFVIL